MALSTTTTQGKTPRWTSPASFFGMGVYKFVLLVMLVSTVPSICEANLDECVSNYDPTVDYFPNKINVDRAQDFAVEYFKNYKVLINTKTNEEAVLYQCGTPLPTGFQNTTKKFSVPVKSVGFTSTTEVTFLEILGVRNTIKYSDSLQYVTSPCIQSLVGSGSISPFSSNKTIKQTEMDSLDIVFGYSKGAGFNTMSVSSSGDPTPLGRSEWIEFLSLFFNKESKAIEYFNGTETRYNCFSTALKKSTNTPKVAWVDYQSYSANKFVISLAPYKMNYIKDAGATPIEPSVGNFATADEWKAAVADADIVIDETYMGTLETFYSNFNLTSQSNFKFIKNQQIWRNDRLQNEFGATDWFESAISECDSVIQDLGVMIKPEVKINHTPIWFRNVAKGEGIVVEGSNKCTNADGSRDPRDPYCDFLEIISTPTPTPTPTPTESSSSSLIFHVTSMVLLAIVSVLLF